MMLRLTTLQTSLFLMFYCLEWTCRPRHKGEGEAETDSETVCGRVYECVSVSVSV